MIGSAFVISVKPLWPAGAQWSIPLQLEWGWGHQLKQDTSQIPSPALGSPGPITETSPDLDYDLHLGTSEIEPDYRR